MTKKRNYVAVYYRVQHRLGSLCLVCSTLVYSGTVGNKVHYHTFILL